MLKASVIGRTFGRDLARLAVDVGGVQDHRLRAERTNGGRGEIRTRLLGLAQRNEQVAQIGTDGDGDGGRGPQGQDGGGVVADDIGRAIETMRQAVLTIDKGVTDQAGEDEGDDSTDTVQGHEGIGLAILSLLQDELRHQAHNQHGDDGDDKRTTHRHVTRGRRRSDQTQQDAVRQLGNRELLTEELLPQVADEDRDEDGGDGVDDRLRSDSVGRIRLTSVQTKRQEPESQGREQQCSLVLRSGRGTLRGRLPVQVAVHNQNGDRRQLVGHDTTREILHVVGIQPTVLIPRDESDRAVDAHVPREDENQETVDGHTL